MYAKEVQQDKKKGPKNGWGEGVEKEWDTAAVTGQMYPKSLSKENTVLSTSEQPEV